LQDLGLRHDSDEAVRVLQQFDRSGDGLLSLDEFGKLVRQLADGAAPSSSSASGDRRWSDGDIRTAFVRFDTNRSGKLDQRELRAALRELGVDADEREAANVLQRYDANANGLMDVGEFTSLVRQLARSGALAPDPGSTAASIMAADARGGSWWASATGAAVPSAVPLPAVLPTGWVETSEPGSLRVYYYNRETRQTQWHRPGTATPIPSSNSSSMRPTPRMPPNAPPRTPERRLPFATLGESSPLPSDRSRCGSFGSLGSMGSKGSSGGSGGRDRFGAPPGGSGYGDSDPRHITNVINAFVRFDANNSGKLDHRELRAALRHLGLRVDGREAAEILRGYDDNGDGVLSMDEFTTLVRRLPLPSSSRKTSWPEGLLGVGGGKKSFFGGSKKPPLHELGA
jgi:Ca2+-binding EF-hand superfamily protein